jgi:hypothetical protein
MGAVAAFAGRTSTPAAPKSAPTATTAAATTTTAAGIAAATVSLGYFSHNNLFP